MFTFRRVVGVALEDFGLSRPTAPEAGSSDDAVRADHVAAARARRRDRRSARRAGTTPLVAADVDELPPLAAAAPEAAVAAVAAEPVASRPVGAGCAEGRIQVVWQGAAARRAELQRFCEHLDAAKAAVGN